MAWFWLRWLRGAGGGFALGATQFLIPYLIFVCFKLSFARWYGDWAEEVRLIPDVTCEEDQSSCTCEVSCSFPS